MTIDPEEILKKDRDGVRIPQWYDSLLEAFIEVSDLYPLPVGFTPASTDAQYPLPISSDRVYCLDVNPEASDMGNFSGEVCDLVNDYTSVNIAPAGVNPKSFTMVLNGPIRTSTIGLGSPNQSLSNGKLILRGIDGSEVRTPIDLSADSTKRGIMFFQFEETAFIEAEFEFYTDDEVTIGGVAIFKTQDVTISTITGLYPHDAQSQIPLLANASWQSGIYDTKNYTWIIASCASDVASDIDGFVVEFSLDKVNWRWQSPFIVGAGKAKTFSDQPAARYMQVRYKNGTTNQGRFDITTKLSPVPSKPSSHRLEDELDGQDDAELMMSQILGKSELTDLHENVATFRQALKVDTALVHRAGVNSLFTKIGANTTTLAVVANVGDVSIDVVSSAAFSIGGQIFINSELYHFHITDITANNIQLDRPIDSSLPIGTTIVDLTNNMAVVGSLNSPISYKVAPPTDPPQIWQLTRIIPVITDGSAMDDGKYGGIPALTNGTVLRAYRNGIFRTGAVWKTNGDMALDMFNLDYTDKAPAGENGMRGRWTFTNAEFIVELDGATGDYAEILIQDDASANTDHYIKAQGRIFGA